MFKTLQKSAVLADFSGILSNIKVFLMLFFLAIKFDRILFDIYNTNYKYLRLHAHARNMLI